MSISIALFSNILYAKLNDWMAQTEVKKKVFIPSYDRCPQRTNIAVETVVSLTRV